VPTKHEQDSHKAEHVEADQSRLDSDCHVYRLSHMELLNPKAPNEPRRSDMIAYGGRRTDLSSQIPEKPLL
jgi:hypothetical protein